jgi:hypothetical protein
VPDTGARIQELIANGNPWAVSLSTSLKPPPSYGSAGVAHAGGVEAPSKALKSASVPLSPEVVHKCHEGGPVTAGPEILQLPRCARPLARHPP